MINTGKRFITKILSIKGIQMISYQNLSFINKNIPSIGRGATIYDSKNRYAYEVLSVDNNTDTVILKRYLPTRIDEESPFSEKQTYVFERLAVNHILIKKINGLWKMENRHTKRWDPIKIKFGVKEEFISLIA